VLAGVNPASGTFYDMRVDKRKTFSLKRVEPLPLPPSLEAAFMEIEKPMVRFADSETPTRANRSTLAQEGR
jgi:hypothetical protein